MWCPRSGVAEMMLSSTQARILALLAQGHRQMDIAVKLGKSPHLVSQHVRAARLGNGCTTTEELMYWYGQHTPRTGG